MDNYIDVGEGKNIANGGEADACSPQATTLSPSAVDQHAERQVTIDQIKAALAVLAQKEGLETVVGSEKEVAIKQVEKIMFPRKTMEPDQAAELEQRLRIAVVEPSQCDRSPCAGSLVAKPQGARRQAQEAVGAIRVDGGRDDAATAETSVVMHCYSSKSTA